MKRFRVALDFFSATDHALPWAWAQLGLGQSYRALAGLVRRPGEEAAYHAKAAASFRAALSVYTAEQHPGKHAGIQADLATAEQAALSR